MIMKNASVIVTWTEYSPLEMATETEGTSLNRTLHALLVIFFASGSVIAAAALYAHSSTLAGSALALVDQEDGLDLNDLTQRITDTKAVGLFSKLSLKKDVDKLEKDLRDYHAGGGSQTLDALKERYDLMVHNLLVMVQDKDSRLADDIVAARDPLWERLADVDEFIKAVG